jgi:hypothetical protein
MRVLVNVVPCSEKHLRIGFPYFNATGELAKKLCSDSVIEVGLAERISVSENPSNANVFVRGEEPRSVRAKLNGLGNR